VNLQYSTKQRAELRHMKLTLGSKITEPVTYKGRGVAREYYGLR
jgi:hypothetical protein